MPRAPASRHFAQDFFGGLFVLMIIDDDGCAALSQANGGSGADAAARAGDEHDFARRAGDCSIGAAIAAEIRLDRDGVFGGAFFVLGGVILER